MLRAQFTFTASSRPGAFDKGAGWKVQSVADVPGADTVSTDVVRRAVRNVGGFVPPPLPELASRADVDALPRCLRLDVLDPDLTCLSHIVAAGPDYSGRPNFFAHGLVLQLGGDEADEQGFLRPADLWGADLWLRPLGTQAVEASEPDRGLRHLGRGTLDDAALEAFTRAHPNQRDLVLAAFERHVTARGGALVIVGDEPEAVATWHRLIGMLLFPANAWALSFSTYERARDTASATGWPFALVGVPASDAATAAGLPGRRFVVLRDDEAPVRAGLGRWKLHDGTQLVAGPWAKLAETVVVAGLLPEVGQQVDALSIECGASAGDEPLWALGAAVLLLDDLPLDDLARDAAELVADHWPPGLVAGRRTIEVLMERLADHATPGSDGTTKILERAGSNPDSLVAQLALIAPVRAALASPDAFERLRMRMPTIPTRLSPTVRQELDELLGEALGWVPLAGGTAPRALLRIAGLMDGEASPADDRAAAGHLARTLLVPALLDAETDPAALGWSPMPAWLWREVAGPLVTKLGIGEHEPGRAFSPATHAWLGAVSLPRGELTTSALRDIGQLEWERAAYRVFRERSSPATALERGAAFLAAVNSSAVTEGRPEDRWAQMAADEAYPRSSLDLPTALVLMDVLDDHIPFAPVLADVLGRTRPTAETATVIRRLGERETVPSTYDEVFERHVRGGDRTDVLVTQKNQLTPVLVAAQRPGAPASAWADVAEAFLRLDVAVLPVKQLPSRLWEPDMPWEEGWELLQEGLDDPAARTLVAAQLICRGARAGVYKGEDQAAGWLIGAGRGSLRAEAAAVSLTSDLEDLEALVAEVTRLTAETPRRSSTSDGQAEDFWRSDAVAWARRIAAQGSGPAAGGRARGRLRVSRKSAAQDQAAD